MARTLALLAALALAAAGCGAEGPETGAGAGTTAPQADRSAENPGTLKAGWETDFERHSVPLNEFVSGGPGKDGIPAIDRPRFVSTAEADWLEDEEPVIELVVGDDARAYPLQILIWHEIVNDEV